MTIPELAEIIKQWQLPEGGALLDRIERMIQPAVMEGRFLASPTATVCGLQYHLGGEQDTEELAELAAITADDHVLDVCCYLGGPAIQLAESFGCRITGIDLFERFIIAASRIAELAGLSDRAEFRIGNATNLPFSDGQFTVVWSQCALHHDEAWLREFHRVTAPRGRLAMTFDIRRQNPDKHSPRWCLQDIVSLLRDLGYSVDHAEDITERDIEFGWKALDRKLSEKEDEYAAVLGKDWVRYAHEEFNSEIKRMRKGRWGNGRIVATKL
ncbi:MAG TPA: methyltransferase domain-containing protein [Dehalococcoidia bacterium]|nr:methyltransferase domain-containing protein [Dehalococcoidia bacterium]